MNTRIVHLLLWVTLIFQACDSIEYSPNQIFDNDSPRDLNKKNLQWLSENAADDTIRFVLAGDSQREYIYSKKLVETINDIPGVDFVLLDGDISDFGLLQEMEWVNEIFSGLKVPYIGVIGNHDLVANGEKVFKRMYGDLNFSFVYRGVKFVCHNTNSREAAFNGRVPDLTWLKEQFVPEDGVNAYVAVAHVPPNDGDFDAKLSEEYINTINAHNTLAALYAHIHREDVFYPHGQNIPYICTNAIEHRQFMLIEIVNGKLEFRNITY